MAFADPTYNLLYAHLSTLISEGEIPHTKALVAQFMSSHPTPNPYHTFARWAIIQTIFLAASYNNVPALQEAFEEWGEDPGLQPVDPNCFRILDSFRDALAQGRREVWEFLLGKGSKFYLFGAKGVYSQMRQAGTQKVFPILLEGLWADGSCGELLEEVESSCGLMIFWAMDPLANPYTEDLDLLKWLLERGANPNQIEFFRRILTTPLIIAAQKGSLECIKLLVEYGAWIDSSVLRYCLLRSKKDKTRLQVMDLLLDLGGHVLINGYEKEEDRKWVQWDIFRASTLLYSATRDRDIKMIKLLVGRGAAPAAGNMGWGNGYSMCESALDWVCRQSSGKSIGKRTRRKEKLDWREEIVKALSGEGAKGVVGQDDDVELETPLKRLRKSDGK